MNTKHHHDDVIRAASGIPLKVQLKKALRAQKRRSILLLLPIMIFVGFSFVLPIADMLLRSVENGIVSQTLPNVVSELESWDPTSGSLPDEAVFRALHIDLVAAAKARIHTRLGSRLNYEKAGMSSLFRKSGRAASRMKEGPFKEQFIKADKKWGDIDTWIVIQRFSDGYTAGYFLTAIDAERNIDGSLAFKSDDERIYVKLFMRTLVMSLVITIACLLLGYPIAYLIAHLKVKTANILLILVLLPFWTSLLVRTSAWKVLLQNQGVINNFLVWIGLVDDAGRLELINNQLGTIIAMTHILLPFMVLPLYAVMKTIPPYYVRAAKSLGANDWTSFWRVYFPQSIPGIGAGAILTFILSIGYYITPALVGGTSGIFISNRIAYHISSSLNWGLAAALGAILLVLVLILFYVYDKIVGIDNIKLG